MKLTFKPLLDGGESPAQTEDGMKPRTFVDLMDRHKALLIQAADGSSPLTPDDFGQFVVDLQLDRYPYVGGAAPRTIIPVSAGKDIVFTANER